MQVEKQRNMPENLKKKQEREQRLRDEAQKQQQENAQKREQRMKDYEERGRQHWESFVESEQKRIDQRREAFATSSFYVPAQSKVLLAVRVKGINKVPPKEKKIMRLLRLLQIGNAVLVRSNKATMNMLRRVEPWVTYGPPTRKTIKQLVYKRGYGKVNKQRIPLTNNEIVEQALGDKGMICVEDLINELFTHGPHFKEVSNFLWPFKLNSPRGGFKAKSKPYLNGGSVGPREQFINQLVARMM